MAKWNPWHGCMKISEGCRNCYVYRMDAAHGLDASLVRQTADFDLPVRRLKNSRYKIPAGQEVFTCLSSDFFLEAADRWRSRAWEMIRQRSDLHFFIITKRIMRAAQCLPEDWGGGYDNVTIACTVENQAMSDMRIPAYLALPMRHRCIICEPLLERVDLHLRPELQQVIAGGESGPNARECRYEWIADIRQQCIRSGVGFRFKQTGARFVKDGRMYRIDRKDQMPQARRAGMDFQPQPHVLTDAEKPVEDDSCRDPYLAGGDTV